MDAVNHSHCSEEKRDEKDLQPFVNLVITKCAVETIVKFIFKLNYLRGKYKNLNLKEILGTVFNPLTS